MKSFTYFLSIFLTFQCGILGLLKLPLKENTLLVENWKVNVVYLVQYPRIELLPNFSIKCLLIESWLKIKNIQFYRINNHFLLGSPKFGTVPFVQFNGIYIEGSENIMNNLNHLGQKLAKNEKEIEINQIIEEILIPFYFNE
uniref:Uncharacterized protein n=1 Tax=Meloidogyne enterolobii TaxID=390850 RepID=A0A6V7W2Z7_MELEN|nr:unnamed protein product [Meloidogyne enterolobii]